MSRTGCGRESRQPRAERKRVADVTDRDDAAKAMNRINEVWLHGDIADLEPLMHPDIVMVFPGFGGAVRGRTELIAGFHEFRDTAALQEFHDEEHHVDVAGNTAIVSFRYDMLYERTGEQFRATGRDLWIFEKQNGAWIAVWRTMLDVDENPA
jgi:ketosteroid isomerase-like protein